MTGAPQARTPLVAALDVDMLPSRALAVEMADPRVSRWGLSTLVIYSHELQLNTCCTGPPIASSCSLIRARAIVSATARATCSGALACCTL